MRAVSSPRTHVSSEKGSTRMSEAGRPSASRLRTVQSRAAASWGVPASLGPTSVVSPSTQFHAVSSCKAASRRRIAYSTTSSETGDSARARAGLMTSRPSPTSNKRPVVVQRSCMVRLLGRPDERCTEQVVEARTRDQPHGAVRHRTPSLMPSAAARPPWFPATGVSPDVAAFAPRLRNPTCLGIPQTRMPAAHCRALLSSVEQAFERSRDPTTGSLSGWYRPHRPPVPTASRQPVNSALAPGLRFSLRCVRTACPEN